MGTCTEHGVVMMYMTCSERDQQIAGLKLEVQQIKQGVVAAEQQHEAEMEKQRTLLESLLIQQQQQQVWPSCICDRIAS